MKNMLKNMASSPRFMIGFILFIVILLVVIFYPIFSPGEPLEQVSLGTFAPPGTYFSLYDATNATTQTLRISDADENRIAAALTDDNRQDMIDYLDGIGVDTSDLDVDDIDSLLEAWQANYDENNMPSGLTQAKRAALRRMNTSIETLTRSDTITMTEKNAETGELEEKGTISKTDYVSTGEVANVKRLILGTDNFGYDVFRVLVSATGTSLRVGILAGVVATIIGLFMGLLSGYLGGIADDIISFITNIFTVIPSFVLLILISYAVDQDARGPSLIAVIIGFTSWTWTCRSVRSQVISLRNRDHVNLSKLSGHSLMRIVLTDILPYLASYVVMAFILQVSSGILSEAQLSMLGLGPKMTETMTLGLMMNWSKLYNAHLNGSWWAYFPTILVITCISFSMNLMNTGLDQVFNPALRD